MPPLFILILLLFLGSVLCFRLRFQGGTLVGLLLFVAGLALGIYQVLHSLQSTGKRETPTHHDFAVGYTVGKHLAANHPEGGTILVLQHGIYAANVSPTPGSQINGLKKGLGSSRFSLITTFVSTPGGEMPESSSVDPGPAAEHISDFTRDAKDPVAVVSFLPVLRDLPADSISPDLPVYSFEFEKASDWQPLLESGAIGGVVVPRLDFDPTTAKTRGSPDRIFEQRFLFITLGKSEQR